MLLIADTTRIPVEIKMNVKITTRCALINAFGDSSPTSSCRGENQSSVQYMHLQVKVTARNSSYTLMLSIFKNSLFKDIRGTIIDHHIFFYRRE